jgi:hypothetical protein
MSIQHFYSQTVADGTATSVVKPSDWNSAHRQVLNIAGNTAGTAQITGSDIVWAGGNNVTLSANGSTVSVVGPSLTAYLTTAQPPGAYLTTAAQSNHVHSLQQIANPAGDVFFSFSQNQQIQFQFSNTGTFTTNANKQGLFEIDVQGNLVDGADVVHIHQSDNNPNVDMLHIEAWGTNVTGMRISVSGSVAAEINKPIKYIGTGGQTASVPMILQSGMTNSVQYLNANYLQGKQSSEFQSTGAYLTTYAAQTADTNKAGIGTTFAGTNVTATLGMNSNGLAMSLSAGAGGGAGDGVNVVQMGTTGTTGTSFSASTGTVFFNGSNNVTVSQNGSNQIVIVGPNVSQYLTTAMVSNAGSNFVGLNSALTANGVSATINSSGVSLNFPAFLTTAAATNVTSGRAGTGFTSASTAGVVPVGTLNTSGLSMGIPAWITTYAAQTNQTAASGNIAGVGTTFAGTNATATMGLNSAGLALSLSVAAGGTINQTGPNIAVAGTTVTAGTVYFSNSPTVTFGMDGASNLTASAAGGAGGGATISGYELFPPLGGNTAFSTGVNGTIYFQKFIAPANIAFSNFERRYSGSTVSSAISAQAAHTISYGLYSLGSGASTSIYNLIASSSMFMQASYSSNLSAGHTVSAGAASYTNSSAGTVGQGNLTGYKHIYFPFQSTITAGGNYAFAMNVSSATTGATGPLRIAFQELSVINNLTIGKIYNSTVAASNASYVGDWAQGVYSSSSNGLPSTLAISGLTNAVSQQRMYLQLDA